ncbi:polysaccharide deacetylase family protein [Methylocapsa acidiphila]|uniref:polysaccharide deacetylase family protein n=1 Tax=Methylocapsa acidiphila TaxID=133552 RepID=UPI0009FDD7A1
MRSANHGERLFGRFGAVSPIDKAEPNQEAQPRRAAVPRPLLARLVWPVAFGATTLLPSLPAAARALACPADALGVSRTLELDARGGFQVGLKSYPQTLALEDREVILTFDDGPAPPTAKILDALASECVKATFFLVGRNAAAMPALVRRAVAEGHTIGHHTFSHPGATLRRLSDQAARAEIEKGVAADEIAAYGAAGAVPRTPFFRFPGFADTPALIEWLSARNIAVFGADLWASDWTPMTPEAQLALVLDRLEKDGRGIVLFHDTKQQTALMMPAFLRELKRRGFKIVHVKPGAEPPALRAAPPGWTSETDKIITDVFAKETHAGRKGKAKASPPKVPAEPAN